MHKLGSVMVCLAVVAGASWAQEPEDAAQTAAEALVDNEQYEESWEQAAELFKSAVTKEQWQQAASGGIRRAKASWPACVPQTEVPAVHRTAAWSA